MPTIISHPAAALALSSLFPRSAINGEVVALGALCSIVPDVDVLGFGLGIRYGDLLGHRGFTHSIFFAAILSAVVAVSFPPESSRSALFQRALFLPVAADRCLAHRRRVLLAWRRGGFVERSALGVAALAGTNRRGSLPEATVTRM